MNNRLNPMYDIRQFKPTLYVLVLVSITGFSLASGSAVMWILATVAALFSGWMVNRGIFKPIPRIVSNIITTGVLFYVIHEVVANGATAVVKIGEFLMLLQVVKLWEQRSNRDYAQLLVLSLLLMVAAAISTPSLAFGLVLAVFLFLALYCCLLFHLKVEIDGAKLAMAVPTRRMNPTAVRQDQRHLLASMRKMTAVVAFVGIVFAVLVFIFFPRGAGAGMLGQGQFKPTQSLVGFTEDVSFQNIARIQQNDTPVAYVSLFHNGTQIRGGTLLLRGVTLDTYTGKQGGWRWLRWPRESKPGFPVNVSTADDGLEQTGDLQRDQISPVLGLNPNAPEPQDRWLQKTNLLPAGTEAIFAIGGAYTITPHQPLHYRYLIRDGELQNLSLRDRDRPQSALSYDVLSSNDLGSMPPPAASGTDPKEGGVIAREIRDYALRPEVSGGTPNGSLGLARYQRYQAAQKQSAATLLSANEADIILPNNSTQADDLDETIANNIVEHLQKTFGYTLDLTDQAQIEGRDPMVAFLYDFKKGHCEYFAGAMTLMCQSLGMKARMCCGFRCNEYNGTPGAEYFIVRQSHAHAWVEVFTKTGWKTFDPTSDRDTQEQSKRAGAWQKVRHLLNFLEFSYGNAVIGYTNEDRGNLIQSAESAMLRTTIRSTVHLDRARLFLDQLSSSSKFWKFSSAAILLFMTLTAVVGVGLIAHFAWERWQMRQRAARIGVGSLPLDEQVNLARQLEFYDDLLRLLGRHRIARLPHQTHREFGQSLLFLPAASYQRVGRLTELFYRIRYGKVTLTPMRQMRLTRVVNKLARELGTSRLFP